MKIKFGKTAIFVGKEGVQHLSAKEAGKIIVKESVEKVVGESIKKGAVKASFCTLEASVEKATLYTISTSVEKIALESSKELYYAFEQRGNMKIMNF